MSTPVLPVILRNLSVCVVNGMSIWFDKSAAKYNIVRQTTKEETDAFGVLGHHAKGGAVVEVTLTPVGMVGSFDLLFPDGLLPRSIDGTAGSAWYRGRPIYTGAGYFHMRTGAETGIKTTYHRMGIIKPPTVTGSPEKPLFGPMTLRAQQKIDVQPTDAAALKTADASLAWSDAGFDEALIIRDLFTLTVGERSSPFDAIGLRTGFTLDTKIAPLDVPDDNVGIATTLVDGVELSLKFAANNLTEAQFDQLGNWQDSAAVLPGQKLGAETFILDSDALTLSLFNAAVVKAEGGYGVAVDRNGDIEIVSYMKFTDAVPDPMVDFTVNL